MAKHRVSDPIVTGAADSEDASVERIRAATASGELASAPAAEPNGSEPAKPKETKAERFVRLARARQPKFDKAINAIANLGNRATYEYTDEQRDKVLAGVKAALAKIETASNPSGNKAASETWI